MKSNQKKGAEPCVNHRVSLVQRDGGFSNSNKNNYGVILLELKGAAEIFCIRCFTISQGIGMM